MNEAILTDDKDVEGIRYASLKKSRARAEEILEAAAEVFTVKGFDATSMNDIAKAVDLTKAGLYHYIRGKQDLLHAIMDFAMDAIEMQVVEPARQIADPAERLKSILYSHIHLFENHGTHVTILIDEVTALTPAHREHIIRRKRAYLDFMRETLAELKKAGRMRDLDVTITALNILSTVVGMARWYNTDGNLPLEKVSEQTVNWILRGVLTDAKA